MSARDTSAPLDLDAIEARFADAACEVGDSAAWRSADDVPALMARVRDLEAEARRLRSMISAETAAHRADLRDDARAIDDLVAEVWRALGETHEPPADVVTLIARVAAARREGAEAMREACAEEADAWADDIIGIGDDDAPRVAARLAAALRALPPPEGDDASPRVAAYRAGAEAMRDALVSALDAMVHAEATEAEIFRLTRDEDSAAEHHHKRAVLLEARVTALSLPLPEVTP